MGIAERVAAKRSHEGRMPCPSCGEPIAVADDDGTLFRESGCDACQNDFDDLDLTALVRARESLDADTRAWLERYKVAVERLRMAILTDEDIDTCFGGFFTRSFQAYAGRNPMTGGVVPVPAKRRRGFSPSIAWRASTARTPRPLTAADLEDEDLLRRSDIDEDDEREHTHVPSGLAIDVDEARAVVLAELEAHGASQLGAIGSFARRREHDDEQLYEVVIFQFRRSVQPDFPR